MADSRNWRDQYLTVSWNNTLTAALGVPALVFAGVALFTSAFSETAAFVGSVVIGAVY